MADKKIKNKCGCCKEKDPKRLNKVGGQAVLDGVMMKAGKRVVTTVRRADGSLAVHSSTFSSVRNDKKILNIPILRGVINFVEMLKLSYTTLSIAADEIDLDGNADGGIPVKRGSVCHAVNEFFVVAVFLLLG